MLYRLTLKILGILASLRGRLKSGSGTTCLGSLTESLFEAPLFHKGASMVLNCLSVDMSVCHTF